ncbi:MAG: MSMEG_0567/Sll0786 family nitrogen starvation N-acetyltransferase [Pseudomonadota bacterium]
MSDHPDYSKYCAYTLKWATSDWEVEQARQLRRRVFCDEQQIFKHDDRDAIDDRALTLVAMGSQGGWHQQVVGTVRIHREPNDVWYGSRLAVDTDFRTEGQLGTALIRLAVSSAHAVGCVRFLATVQRQNERLFQRLMWHTQDYRTLFGHPHAVMEADLDAYPPFYHPKGGFVIKARKPKPTQDVWAGLLPNQDAASSSSTMRSNMRSNR